MKLLVAHNAYNRRGGEEVVFRDEVQLLRRAGHEVREYLEDNNRIRELNYAHLAAQTIWSDTSRRKLRTELEDFRPHLVHFHNTFPLISPSVYSACWDLGIPVVQTLHNYRLLCPGGMLRRDGYICEECLHRRVKWPGILHGCYRESRLATTAVAAMLAVHHSLGTWDRKVNRYVALSEFSRAKFIEGGLPAFRMSVKPNFVAPDPGKRTERGDITLFVGRLSTEKGADFLLEAWSKVDQCIPLRIVGDGPLRLLLERRKEDSELNNVFFDGPLERTLVLDAIKRARFIVCSNRSYENFPLVIAEAYACGVAVIAPRLGVMAEIVRDGVTGLHFEPDNAQDLAAKVEWAWTHPVEMQEMGRSARTEYEAKYTAERNYQILMQIYAEAGISSKNALESQKSLM